ncbi:MAG TPA: NDP-sugar synthase [Thermoanaerobaculia bacterium]|nr:NDP-sugar synthase [Thermoanaerobaculia bacterium]
MRLRALVLAAGLGSRLRPLTDAIPKPLLPVAGIPVLQYTLERLVAVGCEAAAINLHHHGTRVRHHFGASFAGMPLVYSQEPELLGTLGALYPLGRFFSAADLVLLINGDSLCRWPLDLLIRRHRAALPLATLLFTSRADPAAFGGGVGVDAAGRVLSMRPGDPERGAVARRLVFAGAHVLSRELVHDIQGAAGSRPAQPAPSVPPSDIVRDLYAPMLAAGADGVLAGLVTSQRWHDLGTPRRYLTAVLDWLRGTRHTSWISPRAELGAGAAVRGAIVEAGVRIGPGARVERSLLLPGARLAEGSAVRDSIVSYGAEVAAGASVQGRIVVAQPDGSAAESPLAGAPG